MLISYVASSRHDTVCERRGANRTESEHHVPLSTLNGSQGACPLAGAGQRPALTLGWLRQNCLSALLVVLLLAVLSGCAAKQPPELAQDPTDPAAPDEVVCLDLARLPQDLTVYADKAGADEVLVDTERQRSDMERFFTRFFMPWELKRAGLSAKEAFWGMNTYNPDKGYIENLRPFPRERWDELVKNSNARAYAGPAGPVRYAITVKNTALRLMPTLSPYFRYPRLGGEGYPFDYFQNSALWVGTPVAIIHTSRDGGWVFLQTRIATGWVPVEHVALVDESFRKTWRNAAFAAVLEDKTPLRHATPDKSENLPVPVTAHIGVVLPLAPAGRADENLRVLFPERGGHGWARAATAELTPEQAAEMPLPLTRAALARVGNRMMGQPYGWGGMYEDRDCSATTRDLFTPFGVWLPRNSADQARWGRQVTVTGLPAQEKEAQIMAQGVPFMSLVKMKGHVGLYVGTYELDGNPVPVMFHNVWGVRVLLDENGRPLEEGGRGGRSSREGRAVIGKAVVTSLRPGAELPSVSTPDSLLDRIDGLSILPEVDDKPPLPRKVAAKRAKKTKTVARR